MQEYFDKTTRSGTITGTLLTIASNIRSEDLVKTAMLAAVGALVSFLVTLLLKVVVRWIKRIEA
jgi:ABC-type sulfate transport system permease component